MASGLIERIRYERETGATCHSRNAKRQAEFPSVGILKVTGKQLQKKQHKNAVSESNKRAASFLILRVKCDCGW